MKNREIGKIGPCLHFAKLCREFLEIYLISLKRGEMWYAKIVIRPKRSGDHLRDDTRFEIINTSKTALSRTKEFIDVHY